MGRRTFPKGRKEVEMNYRLQGGIVLVLSLVLTAAAYATESQFETTSKVQVNGKQLAPGSYKLKWKGSGPNVEVQFTQGRKILAVVQAKVERINSEYDRDAAVFQTDGGGGRSLVETRFAGRTYKLVFNNEAAQADQENRPGGGDGKSVQ